MTYAAHSVIMNIKLSSGEIRNYRYIYLGQTVCTRYLQCLEVWVRHCLSLDIAQGFRLCTIIWHAVTLLCMYMSMSDCLHTSVMYAHPTWSTWSYLVSEVHIGSMLNQLCHNPHTSLPSCPHEGCLLILHRVHNREMFKCIAAVISHVQPPQPTVNCFVSKSSA